MMLDKIIKQKKKEIKKRKRRFPISKLKSILTKSDRNFKKAISKGFSLIAEIKKGSPSEGIINESFSLEEIARIYEKNKNIKAISVLTDKHFFMGPTCLMEVRKLTKKPILRKDFIIDEYQVYESRFFGADAILLIATLLTKNQIDKFIKITKKYNMHCLVEVHTEKELKKVLKTKAEIIGINNRNLDTLKVDLNTTLNLIKLLNPKDSKGLGNSKNFQSKIPKNKIIVTESGYNTNKEIKKIKNKVNAVLIGTSILKSRDMGKKINKLMK